MRKGKFKRIVWGCLIILVVVIGVAIDKVISEESNKKFIESIMKSPGFSNAVFSRLKNEKGKVLQALFVFEANGLPYENLRSFGPYKEKWSHFVGRSFPVIYNINDPSMSEILVFPSDFAKFKLKYPDSLEWVNKVFK